MEYKFLKITEAIEIPVPRGLSPEEEAAYIADFTARYRPEQHLRDIIAAEDPAATEAACREAIQLMREGELIPFEHILEEVERDLAAPDEGAA